LSLLWRGSYDGLCVSEFQCWYDGHVNPSTVILYPKWNVLSDFTSIRSVEFDHWSQFEESARCLVEGLSIEDWRERKSNHLFDCSWRVVPYRKSFSWIRCGVSRQFKRKKLQGVCFIFDLRTVLNCCTTI
jgi:hypothetical protein